MEAQILVQLPLSARTDADRFQFHGECRKKLLAIFGAVCAMELVSAMCQPMSQLRRVRVTLTARLARAASSSCTPRMLETRSAKVEWADFGGAALTSLLFALTAEIPCV
jgi:hypothetical protein